MKTQWQLHDPPQPAAAGLAAALSTLAGVLSAGLAVAGAGASPVAGALPPLKSVAYQPEPFS